jgi:hypothetical protein
MWQLIVLALVFLAPIVAAWLWKPDEFVNRGELIEPAVPLDQVELESAAGDPYRLADLKGKWHMVHVAVDGCDDVCRDSLYRMRQVRLAQGKELDRVQNLLVLGPGGPDADLDRFLADYPDLEVLVGSGAALDRFLQPFREATPADEAGRPIYMVDPLGNLMMRFPFSLDPTGIRKDLARLLRASRIG